MGYAGGTSADPTYRNMGDHTESVRIEFDPSVISFAELFEMFWSDHDPAARPWSRQYMNAVLFENDRQREIIEHVRAAYEAAGGTVNTRIEPLVRFYPAEPYHQKHALQQFPGFLRAFDERDPSRRWLFDSTAAARLNGFLAGYGTCDQLEREVRTYGLTEPREQELLRIVCLKEGRTGQACPL